VLWGFDVAAEEGGRVLVDATGFFTADGFGVANVLRAAGQGSFHLDAMRAAIPLDATRGFPRHTGGEATPTFTPEAPGPGGRDVAIDPQVVTVREHYSLIALPPPGYRPRVGDPRAGFITVDYVDYAAPLGQPLERRLILRHRLEKKDPRAAVSDPV